MMDIALAQKIMQKKGIVGWLLYDFRRSNALAVKVLKIPSSAHLTRRFCYFIPVKGEPIKLVHAIEDFHLDHLPGKKERFTTWKSFHEKIHSFLHKDAVIALEYSKEGAIPYVSKVDAGFLELIRSFHVQCVSSQDLLQYFTAVLTPLQIALHKEAAAFLDKTAEKAFVMIEESFQKSLSLLEEDVQRFIAEEFECGGFETDSPPICAAGKNSANPHYGGGKCAIIKGEPVLIDLWCKKKAPEAVYGDITRVAFAGNEPSERYKKVFDTVREAQKQATDLVISRMESGKKLYGYEVDDCARAVIEKAGFGPYFIHRTGHNIHFEPHGDGANMDNFETHDDREVLPGTCFSIEPGIYLKGEFGVRLEYDVLIHPDRTVEVTGGTQNDPRLLSF